MIKHQQKKTKVSLKERIMKMEEERLNEQRHTNDLLKGILSSLNYLQENLNK